MLAIPHSTLKMIQRRLATQLELIYRPHSRAFGYIKGRGIRPNAATHLKRRLIFSVDLERFFEQINFGRVRGRLTAPPYSLTNSVATAIATLATFENKLPFGAPTSPILSNIICSGLDAALSRLGKDTGSFYTRYADDLTFSTHKSRFSPQIVNHVEVDTVLEIGPGPDLEAIVVAQGFSINPAKTRLRTRKESQIICGVLCNEKLNTRRRLRREIRALLNAWAKYGAEKVQTYWVEQFNNPAEREFEPALRGKIEFLKHVRGANDPVVWETVQRFNKLTEASPIQYEKPVDWRAGIERSVCVIFAESAEAMGQDAEIKQGSGFVVAGGHIVTNAHVACHTNGEPLGDISVQFHGLMLGTIPVEVIANSADLDVAVLRPIDPTLRALLAPRAVDIDYTASHAAGTTLTLAGYPNYQDGDTVHAAIGHVTGNSTIHGLQVFRISESIIYGNSGGPVFNDVGKAIGIAVCGSGTSDAPYTIHNGAIPARAFKSFLTAALHEPSSTQAA